MCVISELEKLFCLLVVFRRFLGTLTDTERVLVCRGTIDCLVTALSLIAQCLCGNAEVCTAC